MVPLLLRKPSEHIALVLPGEDVLPHGARTARVEKRGVYTPHSLQVANREGGGREAPATWEQLTERSLTSKVLTIHIACTCYFSLLK